jgi:hypothetical protein
MSITPRVPRRTVTVTALVLFGVASTTARAKDPALLTLTTDHFKDTATVTDDPMAGTTTVSTERGFVERSGPMHMVWHDEYLKGIIDRKTGLKSFQVAAYVIYTGSFRSYESATFPTESGPRSVKATQLRTQVELCATGTCTYTERIAFPVDEGLLRQLAADHAAGQPILWRYELVAKSGPAYTGTLSTAEISGFLAKLDETANTVPVVKVNTDQSALRRDLGIEGMTVAATPEQPNRAGILIIGVKSGSVAQKAGMITGDIVYQYGGRPTTTLAELQSAVSASAADKKIALTVYRGTSSMTLTAQF